MPSGLRYCILTLQYCHMQSSYPIPATSLASNTVSQASCEAVVLVSFTRLVLPVHVHMLHHLHVHEHQTLGGVHLQCDHRDGGRVPCYEEIMGVMDEYCVHCKRIEVKIPFCIS